METAPEIVLLHLTALWNPGVVFAGLAVGWYADQWQKVVVGGFVAALAGIAVLGLVHLLGIGSGRLVPIYIGGLTIACFASGMLWSAAGYLARRYARSRRP